MRRSATGLRRARGAEESQPEPRSLLSDWLFELGARRVFLTVVAGNDASMAVARRAGFVHEATLPSHSAWMGKRFDVLVFGKLPPTEANPARR